MTAGLSPQDLVNLAAVGAVVVPPVTSLLKHENWSASLKQAIAIAVSVVVAVVSLVIGHQFGPLRLTGPYLVETGALIFAASQIAYLGFRRSSAESALARVGSPRPAEPAGLWPGASVPRNPPAEPVVEVDHVTVHDPDPTVPPSPPAPGT